MNKKLLFLIAFFVFKLSYSQQDYYNDLDFTKTGLELKQELATKVINTHTNFLSYTPGIWEASKKTDVNPNNSNQVLLIYGYTASGITARFRGINDTGGDNGEWNREHTYPRSLGNPNLGSSGAGSDAHHLRPSDVQYNRQRGSKKFADGAGSSGDVSGGWYPGDEWKGDIARMMMYMYLRYDTQCLPSVVGIGSKSSTPDEMIDLFLKWNAEDPVSEFEDQRNTYHGDTNNTYAQGNRNPFIDNPYLATKIWGNPPTGTNQPEDRWGTLSSETVLLSNLSVYPNPSYNNQIKISIPNGLNINSIALYSIIGKRIFISNNIIPNKNTIEINDLKSGVYLLKITNNNSSLTKKVIIK